VRAGLRVDVDTLRGTLRGVPELVRVLGRRGVAATFFFSVGPDNMGRHLWRLARPAFAAKMLRTRAARLYGWDVLLRGTLLPGPVIGRRAGGAIRAAAEAGHEIGLHAWDHHAWQARVERMEGGEIAAHLERGVRLLEALTGTPPTCSAAPSWRCTDAVLRQKRRYPFAYNSDCRGTAPFVPLLDDGTTGQLQLPTTLPTFDERVGRGGVTPEGYYGELLERLAAGGFQVLTVHAEVEGIALSAAFERFVEAAQARGVSFVPLGELAAAGGEPPVGRLERRGIAGREGWICWQGAA
jgi:undecaprenyl phosphate-alpha-L-ara4FN deformylase